MKTKTVYVLEEGRYYTDGGFTVAVAITKKGLLDWIKTHYPNHKRNRRDPRELFLENDDSRTWLRCYWGVHECPLIE